MQQSETLERIKSRIDTRLNDYLCDMKPDYDDSVIGFSEAWGIVSAVLKDEIDALKARQDSPSSSTSQQGTLPHDERGGT